MLPLAFRLRALARPVTSSTSRSSSRELSVSAGRLKLPDHKKKRILPQRKVFVDQRMPFQKTDEQLDAESITEQLRHQAGHSLKTRFKGIKYQERYFKDAIRRSDKEMMTAASLEGLPDLTEAQVDDFYANLMASGTTLGNLPEVASPTFKAAKPLPSAHSITEEQFATLSDEAKAQIAGERQRLLGALAGRERRRQALFGALGVPAENLNLEHSHEQADKSERLLAALESEVSVEEQDEGQIFETIGVQASDASSAAATLEVGEDGDLKVSKPSFVASPVGSAGPTWTNSSRLRSGLPPRETPSADASPQAPDQPSPSSVVAPRVAVGDTPSAAALLRTVVNPPKPFHDPPLNQLARRRVARPDDRLEPWSALTRAIPAPSSSLTLLDTTKDTVEHALAAAESEVNGEASTIDLGILTQAEWTDLIGAFLSTEIKPVDGQQASSSIQHQFVRLASQQARRKRRHEHRSRPLLPLRKLERDRLVLLRERGDLALEALETAWRAGAMFDQNQKLLSEVGSFLVQGGHVEGIDRLLSFVDTKLRHKPINLLQSFRVTVHLTLNDIRTALATLHELEDLQVAPPQSTYHAVIAQLVQSEAPSHRAAGWNLFGHMRLVAHPTPTLDLYTEMIAACAHQTYPEPERALDLWTEMTIDSGILPDVKAFNAVLLACGRVQRFYPETFRLMRQLLDFYQTSPDGTPQKTMYTPTRATFDALLDGSKRNGDLARARWVLTEMIRFSNHPGFANDGEDVGPTSDTLSNVLKTYANSQAKIDKAMLRKTDGGASREPLEEKPESSASSGSGLDHEQMVRKMDSLGFEGAKPVEDEVVVEGESATQLEQPSLDSRRADDSSEEIDTERASAEKPEGNVATAPLPQSSAEIAREATLLFRHTLTDWKVYAAGERSPTGGLPPLRFARATNSVINGYLAVLYNHDSFANAVAAFKTVFGETGVHRSGHSWRYFLEFAAHTRDRELAAIEAHALFTEWEQFEQQAKLQFDRLHQDEGVDVAMGFYKNIGYTPDNIRRVFAAMIKIMARAEQLVIAQSFVERFVELYPPSDIVAAIPEPLPTKSLVSLVPRVAVRPDPLPPHLLFADVEVLHERYVVYQQTHGLAYLKRTTSNYLRALQKYREARLSQGPEGEVRAKENATSREEAALWRAQMGPRQPVQRYLRKRERSLEDFEGIQADIPDGGGKQRKDDRRRRMLGERANSHYQRGLRQFS